MNPRMATRKRLEDTPTCDPDEAAEISIRDNIGVRVARDFQGPPSVVWGDGRSWQSVLLPISPTSYNLPQTLTAGVEDHSPRGLSS